MIVLAVLLFILSIYYLVDGLICLIGLHLYIPELFRFSLLFFSVGLLMIFVNNINNKINMKPSPNSDVQNKPAPIYEPAPETKAKYEFSREDFSNDWEYEQYKLMEDEKK